ncbi:MAG: M14 family zinc carboxypeptidase [Candidatus Bathyarchaeota archaeon]|nr:M14 family zinc carboxypeptidase [Candidatus Bathyarchaeota archaeon]
MINGVTVPEAFFGFTLGSDGKIARWDKIVEYFQLLERESNRIKVIDMGLSTEGAPFLLVIISSPRNLSRLEKIQADNLKISDPRGLSTEEVEALISNGKAIICQSMSLHASEIAPTQMAPELAYDLLSGDDENTLRILDNVVFLMVPCFNPDGQIMVTDWYEKWKDTEYDGCSLPWLYHKYGGHDNNHDAFQTNMVESQYMATILFRDWIPQAYVDHHQMDNALGYPSS